MKATRADVARLAGVSTATVSYVLNDSRNMSEKTKKLVRDAVKQLNYTPDMIARSMTTNETKQLSLMLNDITNPFYSEIVMGFEAAAIEKGYFVNVCTGYKDINNYLDNYIARRIDGVFIVAMPYRFDMRRLYNLVDNGIKVVVSGNVKADMSRICSIESDWMAGMKTAVNYLRGLGHERIVYLSGVDREHRSDLRLDGYLSSMKGAGLPWGDELLCEGHPPYSTGVEDGSVLARELLDSGKEFTAVICQNDLMAMGAISVFEKAGLSVPGDVSVMGFDDNLFAKVWRPSITTMAVSKQDFGRKAFEMLYDDIKNGIAGSCLRKLELIERESTGPAGK